MSNPTELPDLDLNSLETILQEGGYLTKRERQALFNLARRAQPEGEAPQAAPSMVDVRLRQILEPAPDSLGPRWLAADALYWLTRDESYATIADEIAAQHAPADSASSLSPLCGEQHAESGAPDIEAAFAEFCDREGYPSDGPMDDALRAAFREGASYREDQAESGAQAADDNPVDLWARIHQLEAEAKGPDEFPTWKDAAVAERVRRVKAESALAAQSQGAQALPTTRTGDPDVDAAHWAEVFYRNAETFTVRDLGIVRAAWKEATRRAAIAAKAEAPAPSKPTDISTRLREYAANPGYSHNDYADTMRQAAEEIERYYGGMMAWKQTAEKKDRDWQAERTARVDDRCAARAQQAAAPGGETNG